MSKALSGCMLPEDGMKLAFDEGLWYNGYVMGMLLFHLFLFGPFLVGTLASGGTRSVGNMIVWGIFALLPLTLVLVLATCWWGTDWQNVLSSLGMWGVALALHVAVSAFIRHVFLAKKSDS